MGLREAILEDVKKQGIEQGIEIGEAKRDEELLNHAVPEMLQLGLDVQKIATILSLPLEDVQVVIDKLRMMGEETTANPDATTNSSAPPNEEH